MGCGGLGWGVVVRHGVNQFRFDLDPCSHRRSPELRLVAANTLRRPSLWTWSLVQRRQEAQSEGEKPFSPVLEGQEEDPAVGGVGVLSTFLQGSSQSFGSSEGALASRDSRTPVP